VETIENEFEEEIHIRDYLAVLAKRRWTLAAVFFLTVVATAVLTFSATPIYLAQSAIIIEKENPNLLSIQEVLAVDTTDTDYYQTQYQLIESRAVAREVVRRLDLGATAEFNPPPRTDMLHLAVNWWKGVFADALGWVSGLLRHDNGRFPVPPRAAAVEPDAGLTSAFIERVQVAPVKNSRMVHVGVEAADPELAARMANTLVAAYIDHTLETKLTAAKDAVRWLGQRIDEERKKVESSELALLRYKEENGITAEMTAGAEQITAQKLAELESQVIEARSRRVEAETRYQQAAALAGAPGALDAIPEVMDNELVRQIKRLEVDLYNRLSEYAGKYGANHPKVVAARAELKELATRKRQEVERVVEALRNEYQLATAREQTLEKALEDQRQENLALGRKAVRLTVLQRQAESTRHMYDLLIKRFKETSLTEEMRHGNVRVVDPAEIPGAPVAPNKRRNLLLAVVVGLMAGAGLCFFIEYLDNSIKVPDDVKAHLGIPYLGPVPAAEGLKSRRDDLVVQRAPKSPVSESFRGIRTGIQFSSADRPPQVILVASADRSEGKTFVACNLAATLAGGAAPVAIVDADMRKPRVHRLYGLDREIGLANYLTGAAGLDDVLTPTPDGNLAAVLCGPVPPNPSELLNSERLRALIDALKKQCRYVVIDSPPLSAVADAAMLATVADGVLLVVKAGDTPRQVVRSALEQLRAVRAPILGAVLNGVVMGRDNYYYYQYYYYYDQQKSRPGRRPRRRRTGNSTQ